MKGISVIICCYNSAKRLPETLKYLSAQIISNTIPVEIIVVDNASRDSTSKVASQEWAKYKNTNIELKIIQQPIAGLSHAREIGVLSSSYEYGIFCDDDNWLFPDFLDQAFEQIDSDEHIGLIGAFGIPVFESGKEVQWFKDCFEYFAIGSQQNNQFMYGAGSIYRLILLKEIYSSGFNSLLSDRKGNNLSAGGDMELSILILMKGYSVIANDHLKFYHFMPNSRVEKKYINKLIWDGSKSIVCLIPHQYKLDGLTRKQHQQRWAWLAMIEIRFFISRHILSGDLLKFDYRTRIKRAFGLARILGIYENRSIIKQGFRSLENATWIKIKSK